MSRLIKKDKYGDFQPIYHKAVCEKLYKLEDIEEDLGVSIEQIANLLKVVKNKKYYYLFDGVVHECNNIYVNNIYWNENPNDIFLSVSVGNNELLKKQHNIFDVKLFVWGYKEYWWIKETREE